MKVLKNQKTWVCWKYVTVNGRKTKKPFSVTGIPTGTSADHKGEWSLFEKAAAAIKNPSNDFDGIGFVMPEGYFLLDVDHIEEDSPLLHALLSLFHTYVEISPSGLGYHIYGRVDLGRIPREWDDGKQCWKLSGRYYTKNSKKGLEIYIGGLTNRFATFTGNTLEAPQSTDAVDHTDAVSNCQDTVDCTDAVDHPDSITESITDCTDAVLSFLDAYMKKPEESTSFAKLDTERFIKFSEDQIPEILDGLFNQRNGEKFKALYCDGDISRYGTASEADAALCAMIAFRTGPDPDMIDAIFRGSALYRDKWERADYAEATINAGIKACRGSFHLSTKVVPPFVVSTPKADYVNPTLLAEYVRWKLPYIFVREAERSSYSKYVYQDGAYRIFSDDMFKGAIKAFVMDYNPMLLKMSIIDETFKQLTTDLEYIPQTALNADEDLINFQNGLLDIRDMTLRPHSPSTHSTIQIPCDWISAPSPTPVFDAYINTLTDGDRDTQTLLLEFMGACLSNVSGYRMKKSLFLYGPGDTGKSQLKRLTEKLLGIGNYVGIDLRQMEARFGTSSIYCRRLAGSSDMSFMTISELKTFKMATGGDTLFAEFKGRDSFEFVYTGLLWFCANELPKFGGDDGQWVYDRILPVYCPNVIPKSDRDSKLLDKMYGERAGIVWKAVNAFRAVIDRGYLFTEPEAMLKHRTEYRVENNTALEFWENCMKQRKGLPKNNDPYTVTKVYQGYCRWYEQWYGKAYRKSKKEFFNTIADSLGTTYDRMVMKNAKGTILRDYGPDADAWKEYDLVDDILGGDIRKWAS